MTSRTARATASFFIPPLTATILLYQVLANLQIGFTRTETLVVVGVLQAVAVTAGVLAAFGGEWVRITVLMLSTVLLLDAAVKLPELPHVSGLSSIMVMVMLSVIFWSLRERIHSILLVFLVVIFTATVVSQPRPKVFVWNKAVDGAGPLVESWAVSGPFSEALPLVLHVVFDEMMSPGAMSDDLPGGADARRGLYALGERHGLRTHDSVYSRDYFTGHSLPYLMQEDYRDHTRARSAIEGRRPDDNAYFDDMAERGYRTIVFQTSHINFCTNAHVVACETFDSFDPGGEGYDGLDLASRTLTLWHTLLRAYEPSYASEYGKRLLGKFYDLGTRQVGVLGVEDRYDVQRFPDWFDRFAGFAERAPRGTHIFAHFMVPHGPYLLTGDCLVSGTVSAGYYLGRHHSVEADREAARLRFYSEYLAQLNCVRRELDKLLRALERVDRFRDATIIVHGDHGSRISVGNVIEDYGRRDFIDNYATYFAARAPGVEGGIDCDLMSLPEAFRRYITPGAAVPVGSSPLPVIVNSRERQGAAVQAAMPEFGCAAARN